MAEFWSASYAQISRDLDNRIPAGHWSRHFEVEPFITLFGRGSPDRLDATTASAAARRRSRTMLAPHFGG